MKKLLFIIFFAFISNAYSAPCFTNEENNRNLEKIKFINEFYGDVHSIVDCKDSSSSINKFVCDSEDLKNGILLMSKGRVYAYENATHSEVGERIKFNDDLKKRLNGIIDKEKNRDVAIRKLCYIVKQKLSDEFGGDFDFQPNIYESLESKENRNGIVIDSFGATSVIYLGNSCDAIIGTSKEKWVWYNDGDQFVVALSNKDGEFKEKYRFNHDDKVAKLNCMRPQ
ncbi:hypothetical protein [Rodentibacter caecimuris]|uniref:hypothetical protein n=1 Tax=Rodentibacter caecimuris TaxID=1796644 RepID=UPI00224991F4|nr:hypothetical protein [Rodentibacter heylii]MCX2961157.1 hypothetical protein [Rodentibacter heylii]